jgi:RNA polymerase sigma factor (sigma-70 family)
MMVRTLQRKPVDIDDAAIHGAPGTAVTDPASGVDLSDLFARQRESMVRLARLFTGSVAIAEEIVQEAFLKMHRLSKAPDNADAYLRTTVANLSKNHLRRLRLERRLPPPERVILSTPDIDETWAVVQRLPFRQRAVLVLRFYADMSEADIAQVLHCRPGTVKSSLHRGLEKLRSDLS